MSYDELSNATRIAALEDYNQRLLAENVRLTNDLAAMHTFLDQSTALCGDWQMAVMLAVPHGTVWDAANPKAMVQTITAENVRLTNDAAFMRSFINNEDVRSDFQTVTQMRQALDRERERCGVLEAEVKAWHAAEHLRKDEPHNEFMRLAEARARTRETHALDAAKFVGGG